MEVAALFVSEELDFLEARAACPDCDDALAAAERDDLLLHGEAHPSFLPLPFFSPTAAIPSVNVASRPAQEHVNQKEEKGARSSVCQALLQQGADVWSCSILHAASKSAQRHDQSFQPGCSSRTPIRWVGACLPKFLKSSLRFTQAQRQQEAAQEAERATQSVQDAAKVEDLRRKQEEKRETIIAELAKLREHREKSAEAALANLKNVPKFKRIYQGGKPASD